MHREYTVRGAQAGKHVLCEKPMAISSAECRVMIDACRKANVKLMVAYRRIHYEPTHVEAKRTSSSPAPSSQISSFQEGSSGFNAAPGAWRLTRQYGGGGSLMDVGIYPMNEIRWLTGGKGQLAHHRRGVHPRPHAARPLRREWRQNPRLHHQDALRHHRRARLHRHLTSNMVAFGFLRIHGDKGALEIDQLPTTTQELHLRQPRNARRTASISASQGDQTMHFQLEAEHFANCIRTNTEPKTPGEEGLHDMLAIESIYKAAGTPIA